jgi:intracellular septation protein
MFMRFLADYFPLLIFFVAFKWQGIWVATGAAIAASVVQIAWFHWRGSVSPVHWLSLAIIVVFGGATLWLRDETFIKWKPTVLYLAFGAVLAGGKLLWRRDLLAVVMKEIALPGRVWTRVTWSWVGFFAAMALANWYIAFHLAPVICSRQELTPTDLRACANDVWVNFKVWGGIGLFFAFALVQGLFLARHMTEPTRP